MNLSNIRIHFIIAAVRHSDHSMVWLPPLRWVMTWHPGRTVTTWQFKFRVVLVELDSNGESVTIHYVWRASQEKPLLEFHEH